MDKIPEIFASDKLLDFWPTDTKSFRDNTEASIRFILYASVAIYLIYRDYRYIYLGLAVIALLVYSVHESPSTYETYPGIPDVQVANVDRAYVPPILGQYDLDALTRSSIKIPKDCVIGDLRSACNLDVRYQDFPGRRAVG
jgi:hypothetical protein